MYASRCRIYSSLFFARWFWLCTVGAWLGQVIVFLFLVVHQATPECGRSALCFSAVYSLLSLVGALGARRAFASPPILFLTGTECRLTMRCSEPGGSVAVAIVASRAPGR